MPNSSAGRFLARSILKYLRAKSCTYARNGYGTISRSRESQAFHTDEPADGTRLFPSGSYCAGLRMITPPPAPSMRVGLDGTFGSKGTGLGGVADRADSEGVADTGMSRRP